MGLLDWLRRTPTPAIAAPVEAPQQRRDSVVNPMTGLGGGNDKGASARPMERRKLSITELTTLYEQNGLTKRAIDIVAGDATSSGFEIEVEGDDTDPLAQEFDDLDLDAKLADAMRWARLYGGCVILMVTDDLDGADNGEDTDRVNVGAVAEGMASELGKGANVLALVVMDRVEATPNLWQEDITEPGFGMPHTWLLAPTGGLTSMTVHHSRILWVPGEPVPPHRRRNNDGYGQSAVEAAWDSVRNMAQVSSAGAYIAQEFRQAVLKVDGLNDLLSMEDAVGFKNRMKALNVSRGSTGMFVIGDQDEFTSMDQSVTGFDQLHSASMSDVSAAWGIPQERMFGLAPAGLGTDGDSHQAVYRDRIAFDQKQQLKPPIMKLARVLFEAKGGVPAKWGLNFLPLDEPTTATQAETELKHAQADEIRIRSGVVSPEHVARSRFTGRGYKAQLDAVTEEDLTEMTPTDAELAEAEAEAVKALPSADDDTDTDTEE